jgi:hypothetical protein
MPTAVNIDKTTGCRLRARPKPTGTMQSPMTAQRPAKDSKFGRTANFRVAVKLMPMMVPIVNVKAAA